MHNITMFCYKVLGGFWYILSIQRVMMCFRQQCNGNTLCNPLSYTCPREICHSAYKNSCDGNYSTMKVDFSDCKDMNGDFAYGLYAFAIPVIFETNNIVQILYSNLWGLMALRYVTFFYKRDIVHTSIMFLLAGQRTII